MNKHNCKVNRTLLLASSGLALVVSSAPVWGQDAATDEASVAQSSGGLDEIVVTARKREEKCAGNPDRNYRDEWRHD